MQRRRLLKFTALLASTATLGHMGPLLAQAAASVMVEGVRFDTRLRLAGSELHLNGVGVRAVAWLKGYAAALYVARPSREAQVLVEQPGPKRLRLAMLHDAPAIEFVKALDKGVLRNTPEAEWPALQPPLDKFKAQILDLGAVKKGDVVDLDFDPASGLVFLLNGKPRGPALAGSALFAALLRSFIGDKPYAKDLRAGLLGLPG